LSVDESVEVGAEVGTGALGGDGRNSGVVRCCGWAWGALGAGGRIDLVFVGDGLEGKKKVVRCTHDLSVY